MDYQNRNIFPEEKILLKFILLKRWIFLWNFTSLCILSQYSVRSWYIITISLRIRSEIVSSKSLLITKAVIATPNWNNIITTSKPRYWKIYWIKKIHLFGKYSPTMLIIVLLSAIDPQQPKNESNIISAPITVSKIRIVFPPVILEIWFIHRKKWIHCIITSNI